MQNVDLKNRLNTDRYSRKSFHVKTLNMFGYIYPNREKNKT